MTRSEIVERAVEVYAEFYTDGLEHDDSLRAAIEFALEAQQPTSGVVCL